MSHTPGPWKVGHKGVQPEFPAGVAEISDGSGYVVALVPLHYGSSRNSERESWPSLIAAAPELLEACQRIAADGYGTALGDLEFIRAAIAKATGGEK